MIDLAHLEKYRENNRLEAKRAQGGLPRSIWETYSAFANSFGGLILLGVIETENKTLASVPLPDPEELVRQFWQIVNDPARVSANILRSTDVWVDESGGNRIVIIHVPRADRHDRPMYLGTDPFSGAYRRGGEGDYHCSAEEVRAMMRDQADLPRDLAPLEGLDQNALCPAAVTRYRARLLRCRPGHVWGELSDAGLLLRLGALTRAENGALCPTAAGLLLLGEAWAIRSVWPHFCLSYREQLQPGLACRLRSDGTGWNGALFDFYFAAAHRICADPRLPDPADHPVQLAVREALANALIHADYQDPRGLTIEKRSHQLYITNPGCFRVEPSSALAGGISDARNPGLSELFRLVGVGQRAGSGLPQIQAVWRLQGWEEPSIREDLRPGATCLRLTFAPRPALPPRPAASGSQALLEYLTDQVSASPAQLAGALRLSSRQVCRMLARLAAIGAVEPAGAGSWRLKQ